MAFFEDRPPPPPPPEPGRFRGPPWGGPPGNVLPGAFALRAVLERTERLAIWVDGGGAYPEGALLSVHVRFREPRLAHRYGHPFDLGDPTSGPRFGVLLADGARAELDWPGFGDEPGGRCRIMPQGGSGDDSSWRQDFWLWPLPPPGPLAFFCRWPAEEVPERRAEVDAAIVRDAARDAVELWPDDRPPPDGWTAYAGL